MTNSPRNVFDEISGQEQWAQNSNLSNASDLKSFIQSVHDFVDRIAKQSGSTYISFGNLHKGNGIPIDYHTWGVGIPAHHWMLGRRVIVYIPPPAPGEDFGYHILKRTGATPEFLKELVKDGWVIIKLGSKKEYPKEFVENINELFADSSGLFIYARLIEDAIISNNSDKLNIPSNVPRNLISQLQQDIITGKFKNPGTQSQINLIDIWSGLRSRFPNGFRRLVEGIYETREKVMENSIRLWLIDAFFKSNSLKEQASASLNEIWNNVKTGSADDISRSSYKEFLMDGTPFFYSLYGGANVAGMNEFSEGSPYSTSTGGRFKNFIKQRVGRRPLVHPSRKAFNLIESVGEEVIDWNTGNTPSDIGRLVGRVMEINNLYDQHRPQIYPKWQGSTSAYMDKWSLDLGGNEARGGLVGLAGELASIALPGLATYLLITTNLVRVPHAPLPNALTVFVPDLATFVLIRMLHRGANSLVLLADPQQIQAELSGTTDVKTSVVSFRYARRMRM